MERKEKLELANESVLWQDLLMLTKNVLEEACRRKSLVSCS